MINLWMRWVNFRALRDILLFVTANPGRLRAADLVRLTSEEKVMTGRNGQPLGASSHYHHRRTLERLGLLIKLGSRYALNDDVPEAKVLTKKSSLGETLANIEKEAFANVILRNEDCRNVFFRHFLRSGVRITDVHDFVDRAKPIEMSVCHDRKNSYGSDLYTTREGQDCISSQKHVAVKALAAHEWSILSGTNAVQAIHFGLRAWSVDQLGFLDCSYRTGGFYDIYPKSIADHLANDELELRMVDSLSFEGEWTTIRVGDFMLLMGAEQKVSIAKTREVLLKWMNQYPDLVTGIPTNERFITGGLASGQRGLVLKSFIMEAGGAYVSHLRIHHHLNHRVRRKLEQP